MAEPWQRPSPAASVGATRSRRWLNPQPVFVGKEDSRVCRTGPPVLAIRGASVAEALMRRERVGQAGAVARSCDCSGNGQGSPRTCDGAQRLAHERVIRTLRAWGAPADEAHFVGTRTREKASTLKAFGAQTFFFDDQEDTCARCVSRKVAGRPCAGTQRSSRRRCWVELTHSPRRRRITGYFARNGWGGADLKAGQSGLRAVTGRNWSESRSLPGRSFLGALAA